MNQAGSIRRKENDMLKTAGQQTVRVAEHVRGGEGAITFHEFLSEQEAFGTGRLFSRTVLPVGASIGEHAHTGEFEVYYVLSGEAEVAEDGRVSRLKEGDVHVCSGGHSHSLKNAGTGDLEMLMLILYENHARA